MEDMKRSTNNSPESEDPLPIAPLSEETGLIERAAEIRSDSAPIKNVRQRLGSMAARRSERRPEAMADEQPHIVEQAVIAEQSRFLRSATNPRTA